MNVLGISAFYHDSAASLIQDGVIVAAAQEERFTRKKHDFDFPNHAAAYCLRTAGIAARDLDLVAFYDKPLLKFERLLETYFAFAPRGFTSFLQAIPIWTRQKLFMEDIIKKSLGYRGRIVYPEHHESHAASAFFPSPFDEAAFLTTDGVGEWTTTSFGVGKGNKLEILGDILFPHSLGLLYSAFTYYTGFRVNSGEYKVMGLAPYGEPKYVETILGHLMDLKEDGSFRLDMKYFDYCTGMKMTNAAFDRLFGGPPRKPESLLTQREMDLAASVQVVTELAMTRMARHVRKVTGQRYLCLAGGVALNCVANGKILREGIFEDIWIQPAAGDAGGALGSALSAWHHYLDKDRIPFPGVASLDKVRSSGPGSASPDEDRIPVPGVASPDKVRSSGPGSASPDEDRIPVPGVASLDKVRSSGPGSASLDEDPSPVSGLRSDTGGTSRVAVGVGAESASAYATPHDRQLGSYLGPEFSDAEIVAFLGEVGARYERLDDDTIISRTADVLAGGNVVGWFQGRMEFGPRALGNRSIIGDARSREMQTTMNLKIKFRESFRPFAPSVLEEHISEWFEIDRPSPYMLLVADVREEHRLPIPAGTEALFGIDKLKVVRSTVPSITHVDYSARIQSVSRESNPRYHALISAFHDRTGCPVLVNTSFNVRGEPIVLTPKDAYTCFMRTDMDYLVLGNLILAKPDQPPLRDDIDWKTEFLLD